ncbi:MAG TPA: carbamoyltransferase [Candidatus Gracilibacteria bacterium]
MPPQYILGLACDYHDSSACILRDGAIVAAVQEERFTRKKQDETFPKHSINFCLEQAGITVEDLWGVVFYEKPILKFERLLQSYIRTWPWGLRSFIKAMRAWLGGKLWFESRLRKALGYKGKVYYVPHHLAHGASTYYTSGFQDAAVLTVDGVGEWSTTTIGYGEGSDLSIKKHIEFPHSLGLLYSAFTYYLGFKVNSAEYKVMGLAPYGVPKYKDKIYGLLEVFSDGSFALKQEYFSYVYGLRMVNKKFVQYMGHPLREGEEEPLTQYHKDIAASLQKVTEEIMLGLVAAAKKQYPKTENLCLSGGVALNCVANGRIVRESGFKNVFIFPAAGDSGGSVGAAMYLWHKLNKPTPNPSLVREGSVLCPPDKGDRPDLSGRGGLQTIYLGPEYSNQEIKVLLDRHKIDYQEIKEEAARSEAIADYLVADKVIGLFQGRMEFGPRALGNRSIIADPRRAENWKRVNLKIKFREDFRPFAPSVLREKADECFDLGGVESPYMLLTTQTKRKDLPAITHKDNSARVQTVDRKDNPRYHEIIAAFDKKTGCPVVINTSFNVRGEPIVCTPEDALKGYLRTDIDVLVLENCVLELSKEVKEKLKSQFELETFEKD